jgi:predicted SAM-dependent methyltransferase
MMFGTRETFEYIKCAHCGCLQIITIPQDMSPYYPENYNAYDPITKTGDSAIKRFMKLQKTDYCLSGKRNVLGYILAKLYGCEFSAKLRKAQVNTADKILDIGAGRGRRLIGMHREGFTDLTGIEPFIPNDLYYPNGVKILKKNILDIDEPYDFIMMNHTFEHMDNPFEVMNKVHQILKSGKYVMISTPVVDSYAWRIYQENWVAFDPPRHLFIYNWQSMKILAEKTGFQLTDIQYDSTEYQFWGSEQYKNDIPLRDQRSYYENRENSIFSKHQIKQFRKRAGQLNKSNDGDTACFYLFKP